MCMLWRAPKQIDANLCGCDTAQALWDFNEMTALRRALEEQTRSRHITSKEWQLICGFGRRCWSSRRNEIEINHEKSRKKNHKTLPLGGEMVAM